MSGMRHKVWSFSIIAISFALSSLHAGPDRVLFEGYVNMAEQDGFCSMPLAMIGAAVVHASSPEEQARVDQSISSRSQQEIRAEQERLALFIQNRSAASAAVSSAGISGSQGRALARVVNGQPWLFPRLPTLSKVTRWVPVREDSTNLQGYLGIYESPEYGEVQILVPENSDKNGIGIGFARLDEVQRAGLIGTAEKKARPNRFNGIHPHRDRHRFTITHILPSDFERGPAVHLLDLVIFGGVK